MKKITLISALLLSLLVPGGALATPITFYGSGTAGNGRPMNAEATIEFLSLTEMTIVLKNTAGVGQLSGTSSVLTGFSFTFSTAPSSIQLETGVTVAGTPAVLNCTSGNCIDGGAVPLSGGWNLSGTLGTPVLMAGSGWHPYGIVNTNIEVEDGIPNAEHNPYLNGPVTFTLDLVGLTSYPDVTSALFYFGTVPDMTPGSTGVAIPEPNTILLLGFTLIGLAGFVAYGRKRLIKN
jgi:hypothetical protein